MSCQDTLRAHVSDRKFGSLDDRISRPAALVDPAVPETYASYAWIGLSEPAIVGLPIPGIRLTRFQGDNGAETPGAYPGLDRFGRVARQMWVDDGFAENSGSSAVPNIPPIVSIAYTYDTGSNRTGAFDARPKSSQPLSNMYAYDGLHRLVDARRGVWTGGLASPSVSQLKGSQQWALDPLGNWSSVGTDLDGTGGIDADETETRDHRDPSLTPPTNRVNELFARELAPDTGGGTVDLSYDYAGNLLRQQLQSGGALRYTHDAWNRLVKVEFEDAEEDLHPRAEYEYNPFNWRTVERTDTVTTDSTHALDDMRVHLYDASWRLLESRIDTDFDPNETSPDFEEHAQLVWGLRYIDDIVSTRRDFNPAEEDGAEVRMFHATDAQFSSVAVLLDNGSLLERVAYSPYGVARHQWPADASGDGAVNSADLSIVLSSYGSIAGTTYRSEADFNRDGDGDVDAADLAAVLSYAAALPEGALSSAGIANRTGYCGYRFAPETEMYLARNRWNSPPLGRWIERDPLGYVDGMNLNLAFLASPVSVFDPTGLSVVESLLSSLGDANWRGCKDFEFGRFRKSCGLIPASDGGQAPRDGRGSRSGSARGSGTRTPSA
jgi:RHS repeat-associated protein